MNIDLHTHSSNSDGELSPSNLIDLAHNNKVKILSITDHDTISFNKELEMYANEKGITLINGIEISTKIDKCGIHVLGYNFDINNKNLNEVLCRIRNSRHKYLHDVSKKLVELEYMIDLEELDKIDSVTKAHIALNVINNENNKKSLIKYFGHIPTKGEFIESIMNENCPAYVKKDTITPLEAVKLIKEANGIAILAHPVAYTYEDNLSDSEIINIIKECNFDGIEANYIYVSRNGEKINDCEKWNQIATNLNLFTTLGSDFHKEDKLHPTIGLIGEKVIYSKDELNNFLHIIK